MNRLNSFTGNNPFKPALNLLSNGISRSSNSSRNSRSLEDGHQHRTSMDSVDDSPPRHQYLDRPTSRASDNDLLQTPRSVPLITLSRSPSPSLRRIRSAQQSEDEDELDLAPSNDEVLSRPLVGSKGKRRSQRSKIWQRGGLGRFLFKTSTGHQVYIGLLVFWVMGCQFALVLMDRFLLWTGTYKFPYPLTLTLIQLLFTHIFMLGFASLTRLARGPLHSLGLGAVVAPAEPLSKAQGPQGYRRPHTPRTLFARIARIVNPGTGGIAGGGLLDLNRKTLKQVLPLALIFLTRVVLSNISYAYAVLPVYQVSRIAIVPLSLLFTSLLSQTTHSIPTLSSSLTATLNLLIASIQHGVLRAPWQSIIAGVFSSLFTALYPIQLLRTYRTLLNDLTPQGDLLLSTPSASDTDSPPPTNQPATANSQTPPQTRAAYQLLHTLSLLAILTLLPLLLFTSEIPLIRRNCYFLDVPWFWFLLFMSGLAAFSVFGSTLVLVRATSPETAAFVAVPRSAFQLAVLSKLRLPAHSWVAVGLCQLGSLWYIGARRREGRRVGVAGGAERG